MRTVGKVYCFIIIILSMGVNSYARQCLDVIPYYGPWHDIKSISGEIAFIDPDTAIFVTDIMNTLNEPVYTLTCKSGNIEDPNFIFSGLFQCHLKSQYSWYYVSSLLNDDYCQMSDWEGRSRFLLEHVVGKCALLPDWGADRTFLLRNMRIELGIHNVKFDYTNYYIRENMRCPDVLSYTFTYNIIPDNTALSPIAQKSEISEPDWFYSGFCCMSEFCE